MKKTDDYKYDKLAKRLFMLILIVTLSAEIIVFFKRDVHLDIVSPVIGIVTYIYCYQYSQKIIDKNLFGKALLIGSGLIVLCAVKQYLINKDFTLVVIAGLPVFYIGFSRTLISLFFNYPVEKPTVMFSSGIHAYYRNKEVGYQPSVKEKMFPILLLIGFTLICLGLAFLWCKIK